ncbi:MAG TPA: type II toxin-antitoxin system HicB family antitoxin [Deltaproteobacteria bacterium]|nr:MAG: antitoxin HicB [Deltaproteobacteria bacterium GWA2_45_12]HBF13468.1 type II toxin-antitoxin system HicB family antitoxin [Deltaproteobacteria bacterium]
MGEVLVSVQIERLESGDYLATSQELPDLLAQGRTIAETLEIAQDVLRKLIDSYLEHGDPLPKCLKRPRQKSTIIQIPVSVTF